MYEALTLHNNVIRRAKYANCGSTVQQEGDSYTLVSLAAALSSCAHVVCVCTHLKAAVCSRIHPGEPGLVLGLAWRKVPG